MRAVLGVGKATALGSLMLASSMAVAGTATNTMTSVASVTDSCDIAAVGLDFGITSLPIPAAGITTTNPNTSVGNAITGNTSNPNAGDDGGSGNDDELALSTPDPATNTLITTLLGTINTAVAGVFVACTTTPTAITVTSGGGGGAYNLPVALATAPSGTFSGKMTGVGGGATGANLMDYTLTFTGTAASTDITGGLLPVTVFTAAYLATGSIPFAQSGTLVPGYYADVATAQVDF